MHLLKQLFSGTGKNIFYKWKIICSLFICHIVFYSCYWKNDSNFCFYWDHVRLSVGKCGFCNLDALSWTSRMFVGVSLDKTLPSHSLVYTCETQYTYELVNFRKKSWKKVKLLKMSNFTFFHIVFYAICILKSFNSQISVVVCSFFEFGIVSKCCIREWVN